MAWSREKCLAYAINRTPVVQPVAIPEQNKRVTYSKDNRTVVEKPAPYYSIEGRLDVEVAEVENGKKERRYFTP
jgi:hypothetical protein